LNSDTIFLAFAVIISIALPAAFWAGTHAGHSAADASIDWLRVELQQANERLFAVSREPGAVIPPRQEVPVPLVELPRELEQLAGDFESANVQETLRAQFRALIVEGVSPGEIVRRHLES
jgi:hypothetical protein